MKKKNVVGDMGDAAVDALYARAERQLDDATRRLIPEEGRRVKASLPWVQELLTTAAQLAAIQPQVNSKALDELEREIMLLLAYNVEGDARKLVAQKRVAR